MRPKSSQKSSKKTFNSLCKKADKLRLENLHKEAISHYLNAVLIDRSNANSYLGLGICYKHLEKYPQAIKYLEKATEIEPDFYEAYYELGAVS
mgnify:FL=1